MYFRFVILNFYTPIPIIMKKIAFSFLMGLVSLVSVAQSTQNTIWSLPPNYVKHEINGPVTMPLPTQPVGSINPGTSYPNYYGQPALYSHNAMQDQNGNVLFFIVDGK